MVLGPIIYLCGRPADRHPLLTTSNQTHIDFWGPCMVVSLYGAILWMARVPDVPWIYVIWSLGATFNHFVCRVWFNPSKLMIHSALLGYSITPIIPLAGLIIILRPQIWLVYLFECIAIFWSTLAAILSYVIICNAPSDKKHRLKMLIPSIILMEMYLISLLPMRR